jgi:hypothetical protein
VTTMAGSSFPDCGESSQRRERGEEEGHSWCEKLREGGYPFIQAREEGDTGRGGGMAGGVNSSNGSGNAHHNSALMHD